MSVLLDGRRQQRFLCFNIEDRIQYNCSEVIYTHDLSIKSSHVKTIDKHSDLNSGSVGCSAVN